MSRTERDPGIDLLRGIVIVLMALDHTRDYFSSTPFAPTDLDHTWVALFFTRWITHFCAPVFVFLAGVSAWLHQRNGALDARALGRFLAVRGLWLVALELFVVSPSWSFMLVPYFTLQVIWAIGVSMLTLALLVQGPRWLPLVFGAILVLGHNLTDALTPERFGAFDWVWKLLHLHVPIEIGPDAGVFVAYPLIPWVGVMALGYALAPWVGGERRRPALLAGAGLAMIAAFVALRVSNVYGDPSDFAPDPRGALWSLIRLVNTTKYPPSLSYLLMTLGPAAVMLALLTRVRGRALAPILTFGRVPLFFYLLHIPLLHLGEMLWFRLTLGHALDSFPEGPPPEYAPSLPRCYLAWMALLLVLYPLCAAYGRYKRAHPESRVLQLL